MVAATRSIHVSTSLRPRLRCPVFIMLLVATVALSMLLGWLNLTKTTVVGTHKTVPGGRNSAAHNRHTTTATPPQQPHKSKLVNSGPVSQAEHRRSRRERTATNKLREQPVWAREGLNDDDDDHDDKVATAHSLVVPPSESGHPEEAEEAELMMKGMDQEKVLHRSVGLQLKRPEELALQIMKLLDKQAADEEQQRPGKYAGDEEEVAGAREGAGEGAGNAEEEEEEEDEEEDEAA